jgi:AraC-like DNA-binding protein
VQNIAKPVYDSGDFMLITDAEVICTRLTTLPLFNDSPKEQSHLLFVYNGKGALNLDGTRLEVNPDVFIFVPSFKTANTEDGDFLLLQVLFKINNLELSRRLGRLPRVLPIAGKSSRLVLMLMLKEYTEKNNDYQDAANLALMQLLFNAVSRGMGTKNTDMAPFSINYPAESLIQKVIDFSDRYLADEKAIEKICLKTNKTRKELDKFCKQHFGLSFLQFLNKRKLLKAEELLYFSSYNVTEIAELTGFKSVHYFSRYFKMKEKINPQGFKYFLTGGTANGK